jgi:release factor glutamine methyltransferase
VNEIWTVLKVLKWTQGRFAERGIATARLDAELLLAHVLGKDRVGLYTHFDQPLAADELTGYRELIKRRLSGEPVAYLVGKKEFRSMELAVDARVLVPRPETEHVVEVVLELLEGREAPRVVDVGTGSGAIALAVQKARPDAQVLATDRSPDAAAVARANAEKLELTVEIREGSLLEPVRADGPFDVVASNPPYIPSAQVPSLPAEVLKEPMLALDGGPDGLTVIRPLLQQTKELLKEGGAVVLEVADGQAPQVVALLTELGFAEPQTRKDLAGHDRVVYARK